MRTALIVAITLAFAIGTQAQTRADRSPSDGSAQAAGRRVETQTQSEARQQQMRDPVSGVRSQSRILRNEVSGCLQVPAKP